MEVECVVDSRSNTGDKLAELLERRLDNVVRRAGFCRTIWQARQVVVHGHIHVNGKRVDRPSYQVTPGDKITVRAKSQKAVTAMAESVDAGSIGVSGTVGESMGRAVFGVSAVTTGLVAVWMLGWGIRRLQRR